MHHNMKYNGLMFKKSILFEIICESYKLYENVTLCRTCSFYLPKKLLQFEFTI